MKKCLILILCIFAITGSSHSFELFGWFKKDKKEPQQETARDGYNGTLPNVQQEFDAKRDTLKPPSGRNFDTKIEPDKLTPVPRDNPKYVDIIIKKDTPSPYLTDINDVIFVLEKMKSSIENQSGTQFFNAQAGTLINHVNYLQEKYHDKIESSYISYRKLVALSRHSHDVAVLSAQSQVYKKYLPYEESGAEYSPQNIELRMNALLKDINSTLAILKAAQ